MKNASKLKVYYIPVFYEKYHTKDIFISNENLPYNITIYTFSLISVGSVELTSLNAKCMRRQSNFRNTLSTFRVSISWPLNTASQGILNKQIFKNFLVPNIQWMAEKISISNNSY